MAAAAAAGEEMRKKTACVTGGNGYIASLLIKMLLEKGYVVKTTVRHPEDKESNSHLEDLKKLGTLEIYRADLGEEGSYDEAVAGCDYAFLLAAPVNYTSKNPGVRVRVHKLNVFRRLWDCLVQFTTALCELFFLPNTYFQNSFMSEAVFPLLSQRHKLDEARKK